LKGLRGLRGLKGLRGSDFMAARIPCFGEKEKSICIKSLEKTP